jgi:hypothetical protein
MRRKIFSLGCARLKFSGLERYKTHAQEPDENLSLDLRLELMQGSRSVGLKVQEQNFIFRS